MAKKQYYLIVDTETTIANTVADFGAIVVDRKGNIVKQCAVLVKGEFDAKELFYNPADTGFWGKQAAETRKGAYLSMLNDGRRMLATVGAINRWLEQVKGAYNPTLTAYNLPFDTDKCQKTNIDLTMFASRFCLWSAALGNICSTKKYKEFILMNHVFTGRTDYGNMSIRTNAETVTGYLQGELTEEPHTALEDAIFYELPILTHIVNKRGWQEKIKPFNWREWQAKDHLTVK